jgi:hypothetical protein
MTGTLPTPTADRDGIIARVERGPRGRRSVILLAAAAVAAGCVWLALEIRRPLPTPATPPAIAARPASQAVRATAALPEDLAREADRLPPALRARLLGQIDRGEEPTLYLDQLPRGDGTGIDAFPRPGTKPIKGGLIVPEDYEVPPGYVRHHQFTDDGERVPPILMFHPDHRPVDEHGRPIELPRDGVVPPELAPPDLPLVALEPPPVRRDQPPAAR